MSTSLPIRVVASAAAVIASKLRDQPLAEVARLRALGELNTGARCMERLTTVTVTPPHSVSRRMPRL